MPNPARMWNYWLGGKDNFAADRELAERVLQVMPSMPLIAQAVRLFLIDAVHQLATVHGIRQFLDIGTGLPTADNTHDVAQRAARLPSTGSGRGPAARSRSHPGSHLVPTVLMPGCLTCPVR